MVVGILRPASWEWLLFVHLFAAFSFVGAVVAVTAASIAASRRDNPREVALLSRVARRLDQLVVWPSFLVLLVAGLWLAGREDVFDRTWLQVGIALTVVGAAAGAGILSWDNRRTMRRAEQLAGEGVERSDELRRMTSGPLPRIVGPLLLLLLVALLWLMTAKPGA